MVERNIIRFYVGKQLCELREFTPHLTLLEWLRVHYGRTGCKEGCNEGDCGACTVCIIHKTDAGDLQWKAVNACIALVGSLDSVQIFTIEDVKKTDGSLHIIQQAMIDHHGSQCGFCTPGFIMSMLVYIATEKKYDVERLSQALSGNLCRCTGYSPMKKAMAEIYEQKLTQEYLSSFQAMEETVKKRLQQLEDKQNIEILGVEGRFSAPYHSDFFAHLYQTHPDALLVAGGSDVGLWITKKLQKYVHIIVLNRVADFKVISLTKDQSLFMGAGVTFKQALPVLSDYFPALRDFFYQIAGEQVRSVATLCGNIANASPIGDGPPVFIALGAKLHLRCGQEKRTLLLEEYFIDYGQQDRKPGEFIEGLSIPLSASHSKMAAYKISKRMQQDISTLAGVFTLHRDKTGRIKDIRLAFGGMAAVPKRALHAESALRGQVWGKQQLFAAQQALHKDFKPLSDVRASSWYRLEVAKNLLAQFYMEDTGVIL
ncbi:xanthine dehydrogenase small subunit [Entomobacter blattae]|uniref:FAD binding domain in molybdopterin dehydrogenase n=1 Tax=Entomobacter blattae TaxID=2762277 RepID=A0A7H1NU73_9PROT|nr:xanthine dehydrogenase small subunit [Entomobacter blattae]QNT79333.1 FAD binding domain in molybdopterin dehydrogenase [Entomobacter blattae]